MKYKIVSDSSSDILSLDNFNFESVPLKIITSEKEYIDDENLDVNEMVSDLSKYKGKSQSSCPNIEDWTAAFDDSDEIFCITITSGLSGSYNSARLAIDEHLEKNPDKKGYVIDSLTTGPESVLIIEKLQEFIASKFDFETIKEKIEKYKEKTHLIFSLESLRNLANNGRVSFAVAKFAGLLGIRIIGKASDDGVLEITNKSRGNEKALSDIFKNMLSYGYNGGKVRIHHCQNLTMAEKLKTLLANKFPNAIIKIQETRALCSFYAEAGGLLVGFEG